jgi:hypothetical protein
MFDFCLRIITIANDIGKCKEIRLTIDEYLYEKEVESMLYLLKKFQPKHNLDFLKLRCDILPILGPSGKG